MKVALSTQQVTPVYPGKPLYTQSSASVYQKQKEGTNFKEEFSQIHVKERSDGYQIALASAMALYNDKHTEPELKSYHFDNKREIIRRMKQPPRILDLRV
ncbi:hypothetical protein [Neptuniibacter caesariensis]|uniref:Deoxycytidine triphosphate deaminase n=1 Tax=Neptuniibacter caesariensis TaxID=207954 RepID=A0A7U8C6K2_NEPCE|nr:hypothetical protein [Neptuniibacter caesariensis]EAR62234.1 deoxycytidine triphosphate deaminase [Oceanospirillum sp. MED92] [Neptuniibacter caesariensis]